MVIKKAMAKWSCLVTPLGIGFAMLGVLSYCGLVIGHVPAVEGAALLAR